MMSRLTAMAIRRFSKPRESIKPANVDSEDRLRGTPLTRSSMEVEGSRAGIFSNLPEATRVSNGQRGPRSPSTRNDSGRRFDTL